MTELYTFTDPDGDSLTVEQDGDNALITIRQEDDEVAVLVPRFQIQEAAAGIVTALYEAAGLPVPDLMRPVDEAEDTWERLDPEVARPAAWTAGGPADG